MTCKWRAFPLRFRLDLPLLALLTFAACEVTAASALEGRLRVVPVLFIPSDNSEMRDGEVAAYKDLIRKYLALAQSYYRTQLVTDSFEIADGDPLVYTAKHPHSYYDDHFSKLEPDVAHVVVRELFAWLGEDRYTSRSVYLQIYARPSAYPIKENYYGGGRTFNGPPNTGGGVIQMELAYLMGKDNYPFLSTLIHELGHAFSLTHADCHGYDMDTNGSMMAYNTRLWSKGFSLSVPPPVFNPEEYLMLAQNKPAFPNFNFIPARHNPRGKLAVPWAGWTRRLGNTGICPAWVLSSSGTASGSTVPRPRFIRDKRRVTIAPGTRRPIHTPASRALTAANRLRSAGALRSAVARPPQRQKP